MNKAERGYQAEQLLENPIFKEALSELDAEYHRAWREAKTVDAREDLFRYVKTLERIATDIKQIAVTGQLERRRLEELEGGKRGIWDSWKNS